MGAALGVPSVPVDEVARIAKEGMEVFVPLYLKAYPAFLVKQAKKEHEDAQAEAECKLQLKDPPRELVRVLEGVFDKRGDVRKSWKTRNFVAVNAAGNYKIRYFKSAADKEDDTKALGEMCLDGYTIEHVDKEEEQAKLGCGKHGLKMTCGRRRTWVVSFENPTELEKWKSIFQQAASRAEAPMNDDKVLRMCFQQAYEELRWHYGWWGWWRLAGTECEMLGELIADECRRECMRPVREKLEAVPAMVRDKVEEKLDGMLFTTINSVVSASWKTTQATVAAGKKTAEAKIRENLTKIFEVQRECKNKIKEKILAPLPPLLEKVTDPVLKPASEELLAPIFAAFAENVALFKKFTEELEREQPPKILEKLNQRRREAEYYWDFMQKAYEKLHKFTRSDKMRKLGEKAAGLSMWAVEDRIEEELQKLQRRALHTLAEDLRKKGPGAGAESYAALRAATLEKLLNDSRITAQECFMGILVDALTPALEKHVKPPLEDLVKPIAELVPSFLRDPPLVDVMGLLSETLEETLRGACEAVAEPLCEQHSAVLKSA